MMKEINIAKTIIDKRKNMGLTQKELAEYIGVSKASVSKWETGQSYPDITFLPELASYFNISIDQLMNYTPQMSKEEIRKLYSSLSKEFSSQPFDNVLKHCQEIIKKYYSCFPLLLNMGILLLNYSSLAKDPEQNQEVITKARDLFQRVRTESSDVEEIKQALSMEATCKLSLNDAVGALDLLDTSIKPIISNEAVLAGAYQMLGKAEDAKTVLQIGSFNHLTALVNLLSSYMTLCVDEPEIFEEVYQRTLNVADIFHLKQLQPWFLMTFYLMAAQGFITCQKTDEALSVLEKYAQLVTSDIYPLYLKGDNFFNLIDDWFDELTLGSLMPRDQKTVHQSMVDFVVQNPIFAPLAEQSRFKSILNKLKYIPDDTT